MKEHARGREAFDALIQRRREALSGHLERVFAAKPPGQAAVLEIGAGHGHFLTAYAREHPDHWCLGIDLMADRVRRAEKKRERGGHENLWFIHCDALDFLACLPTGLVFERVFVLFPDPWPKKRHHKNRLLAPRFLQSLATCCAPGTRLYFRTDHFPYFEQVEQTIRDHSAWRLLADAPWAFESPTVFEQRTEEFASVISEHVLP